MPYTTVFDPTIPTDTDIASFGAGDIRELKQAIIERLGTVFNAIDDNPLVFLTALAFPQPHLTGAQIMDFLDMTPLAASRVRPGATSWGVTNNADSRDNLVLLDSGDLTAFASLGAPKLFGTGAVEPTFSFGAGAGGSGAGGGMAFGSDDVRGVLEVLTYSSGVTEGVIATVTFASPYIVAPIVIANYKSGPAGVPASVPQLATASTPTGFTITSLGSALAVSSTYFINYMVIG